MTAYALGDVCSRLRSGKSIPAANVTAAGAYPVMGGNGLRGYTDSFNFEGDCAIIGRQGAACGNVRFFSGKAYMTEHAVVTCANGEHDTHYLAYLLSTMDLGRLSAQSAQPGLSVKTLAKQTVNLPALDVQRRTVELLGKLDRKIALNRQTNDYLTAMTDARFAELVANAEDEIQLPQAINILSGGTPKTKEPSYWEDGTIPFFGPGDVKGAVYTLETEKHITELGLDNCNSSLYPVNTVFLTARGTVGKVAIAGRPMAMNQSCFAFSGIDWVPQTYVYQVIKRAVRSLKAKSNGATFAAINTRDLKDEMIPMPHRNAVEEYDKWATPLYALMLANEEESIRLASLRDALLPKLMSGEVDVSRIELPMRPNNHLYPWRQRPNLA